MSIYHLTVKSHSRNKTKQNKGDICAVLGYRAGIKLVSNDGQEFDYSKKKDCSSSELVFSDKFEKAYSMENKDETETNEIVKFWKSQDLKEKKSNSNHCREIEFALPVELSKIQQEAAAREFAKTVFNEFDLAGSMHFHKSRRGKNPHCHLMMTTRDSEGNKVRKFNDLPDKEIALDFIRKTWEHVCNKHLLAAGHTQTIDHRSNADRGIIEVPTTHTGSTERGAKPLDQVKVKRTAAKHQRRLDYIAHQKALKNDELIEINGVISVQNEAIEKANSTLLEKKDLLLGSQEQINRNQELINKQKIISSELDKEINEKKLLLETKTEGTGGKELPRSQTFDTANLMKGMRFKP